MLAPKFTLRALYHRVLIWTIRASLPFCISMICIVLAPVSVLAHPLGNFTINRYSRLRIAGNQIQLTYIVDMAEIPAHQERARIDQNSDNTIDDAERETYVAQLLDTLSQQLILHLNGQPQPWRLDQHDLTFPAGQAGLPTLRLVTQWTVPLDAQPAVWQADYHDESYLDRLGWQEVIVQASDGVNLEEASVPSVDVSQELRTYPDHLLQSPLAVNRATFRFASSSVSNHETALSTTSTEQRAPVRTGQATDALAALINVKTVSPFVIQLALLAAFGWGAVHALSPGHGKTIVAAYLVGSRGTVRHALFLGLITTVTHTAGVLALGFVTLFAAQFILPEKLYPWLSMVSGVLVVAIGAVMSINRLRSFLRDDTHRGHHGHDHSHHVHDHSHEHSHDHSHGHGYTHYHVPPGVDNSPVTWRGLLALGISGGLLPCPSALVLMLGAISLHRIGFGLALLVMFSLGLASVLTAIGIVLVYAGQLFQRIPESGPLFRFVPVASAIVITVIGIGITVQALMQIA